MFTVKQISRLAGVTPRTLHHYDAIGLLKPTRVGSNGYRYYGEESLLRLQQILFYRELDLPLEDIKNIMGRHDFDVLGALESHKGALNKQAARLQRLVETVDHTIDYLKGKTDMSNKALFQGFTEEEEKKYTEEAMQLYDPQTVKASVKTWKAYSAAEKERIGAEGQAIYLDLTAAIPKGPASAEAQDGIRRWRKHIEYFWTPNDAQLVGLAGGYNEDLRFRAFFEKIHPQLAGFIRDAVDVYVKARKK